MQKKRPRRGKKGGARKIKKYRGKGIGSRIFGGIHKKINEEKSDYMLLVSRNDREKSHKMYKRF